MHERLCVRHDPWFQLAALTGLVSTLLTAYNVTYSWRGKPQAHSSTQEAVPEPSPARDPEAPILQASGYLGVWREGPDDGITGGARVDSVIPGSPAAEAKIQKGDVIRKVNGRTVNSSLELQAAIGEIELNQTVELEVTRNGRERKVTAKIRAQPDPAEMFQSLLRLALAGDVDAQLHVGRAYTRGSGVRADPAEAAKWFEKAAAEGNAAAQFQLAESYSEGTGVSKDPAEATVWFEKAAVQGHTGAQYNLAVRYLNGENIQKNAEAGLRWLRQAAGAGDERAQLNLGRLYQYGKDVPVDPREAVKWYMKAAFQGNAAAECNLGVMYETGSGVENNLQEALKWYRRAAEKGNAAARTNLGAMYLDGRGVPKDVAEAERLLRRAVDQEQPRAAAILAQLLLDRNPVEATTLARKAAEQGDRLGQYVLGFAYGAGVGVPLDHSLAAHWLQKSADQGNRDAAALLTTIKRK